MSTPFDVRMMQRCLALAKRGAGQVSPNPLVGCVIVRNGRIVGEGWHRRFGGPHAEIFALLRAGPSAKGAVAYVNLEPCAHFGKTPPCVDALIRAGIAKAVIAAADPNPLVHGRGIRRLRNAGIRVDVGCLKTEAESLNEKFFRFMISGLPFVGVKFAQTLDGYIADRNGRSKWISSEQSRASVHRLRTEYDAVLVGAKTVLHDDPRLTVRHVPGRNPVRVVIDGRLSSGDSKRIFRTADAPTWLLTSARAIAAKQSLVQSLVSRGVRVLPAAQNSDLTGRAILRTLAAEGISSVLIEGGSKTAAVFFQESLVDVLYLFTAPMTLGGGTRAIAFHPPRVLRSPGLWKLRKADPVYGDLLIEARFQNT